LASESFETMAYINYTDFEENFVAWLYVDSRFIMFSMLYYFVDAFNAPPKMCRSLWL
jgi:hypothetical protein